QEFHELELLDEITALRFEGNLWSDISGLTRNDIILSYRSYRGMSYIPCKLHSALKWNQYNPWLDPDPLATLDISDYSADVVKEKLSVPQHIQKWTRRPNDSDVLPPTKKQRSTIVSQDIDSIPLAGIVWENNSCAYDSVFTILYSIWMADSEHWNRAFNNINEDWLGLIGNLFLRCKAGAMTL
ncbi:hypothetical protein ARMGADRAFT_897759, partial [Armillaria gallica]